MSISNNESIQLTVRAQQETGSRALHRLLKGMIDWDVVPTNQAAHIADPSGGATIDAEARTAIDAILVALETAKITASS